MEQSLWQNFDAVNDTQNRKLNFKIFGLNIKLKRTLIYEAKEKPVIQFTSRICETVPSEGTMGTFCKTQILEMSVNDNSVLQDQV